jgi:hypothetical protein
MSTEPRLDIRNLDLIRDFRYSRNHKGFCEDALNTDSLLEAVVCGR